VGEGGAIGKSRHHSTTATVEGPRGYIAAARHAARGRVAIDPAPRPPGRRCRREGAARGAPPSRGRHRPGDARGVLARRGSRDAGSPPRQEGAAAGAGALRPGRARGASWRRVREDLASRLVDQLHDAEDREARAVARELRAIATELAEATALRDVGWSGVQLFVDLLLDRAQRGDGAAAAEAVALLEEGQRRPEDAAGPPAALR
jgi:hypothetical protein